MNLSRPLTDIRIAMKFAHKFDVRPRLKTYFRKCISPVPKNMALEKFENLKCTLNYRGLRQSEAHNFETAEHVDKQISCV